MQIKESTKEYDVIIVGSGAGGGMATKILSEAGLSIALVEAGPFYDPANPDQMTQMKWSYESPRRGSGNKRPYGDFDQAYGGWEIDGEPYTQNNESEFRWFRSRMLGGRTNHWGRISLRFGPDDFRRKSIDGLGENWPISYDDIKSMELLDLDNLCHSAHWEYEEGSKVNNDLIELSIRNKKKIQQVIDTMFENCLLYTSPSPRD